MSLAARLRSLSASRVAPPTASFQRSMAGWANWPKNRKKNKKKVFDLGWDKLTAPLEEQKSLRLPSLTSLLITHGSKGEGHSGARKFKAILPFLRWHNPSAHIKQQWDLERPEPHVSVVVNNGET